MTIPPPDYAREARAIVDGVAGDPQGRLRLRETFYAKYGFGEGAGYGTSELAFLRWEIRRGVLDEVGGSPWWRAVNLDFLYEAQLAELLFEAGVAEDAAAEYPVAAAWLAYLRKPSPQSWYRAHNTSIVRGYLTHTAEALEEGEPEQVFVCEVLWRLLYAQAMVEDDTLFGWIGAIFANPQGDSVNELVRLPDFYPDHYPLSPDDVRHIFHKGTSLEEDLVDLMDCILVLPHIERLFRDAAGWLSQPRLLTFIRDGKCVYPDVGLEQDLLLELG